MNTIWCKHIEWLNHGDGPFDDFLKKSGSRTAGWFGYKIPGNVAAVPDEWICCPACGTERPKRLTQSKIAAQALEGE